METRLIERFLSENSSVVASNVAAPQAIVVKAKDRFRPDKVYGTTAMMKWDMIVAGIDSPYMIAKGRALSVPEDPSLRSELAELKEFKL